MITLSSLFTKFESAYFKRYSDKILPSQHKAFSQIKKCRTTLSPMMKVSCSDCEKVAYIPHSCGHRSCPHCQAHEGQEWIERQRLKQLPVNYFMITFTLPKELRSLAYHHQKILYRLLFQASKDTLNSFGLNDNQLKGTLGIVAVLHTHSRRLDYHPHCHTIVPAGAMDKKNGYWREKKGHYLFNHKALATVFRGKLLAAIIEKGLTLPNNYPKKWVVDCKKVGSGEKAFIYLGRYLYRGVIQEKDILRCENGQVTFRYTESKTKTVLTRTLSGEAFIHLILQHVLPHRFRRVHEYGILHPNSKTLIARLHYQLKFQIKKWAARENPKPVILCPCGGVMQIIQTRLTFHLNHDNGTSHIPIPILGGSY